MRRYDEECSDTEHRSGDRVVGDRGFRRETVVVPDGGRADLLHTEEDFGATRKVQVVDDEKKIADQGLQFEY